MTRVLFVAALLAPSAAFACGGKPQVADKAEPAAETQLAAVHANVDPTHCAKKSELVGANCSYATGMMAQRVLEEGSSWNFTGSLTAATNALDSRVAAPYTVGPNGSINVIANEVLEQLIESQTADKRIALTGKVLEVDGVQYFVATEFAAANS